MHHPVQAASYLAHNIRYLRAKKNLSQQQLAHQADIPRTTLTHMESGQGNPALNNLIKVAGALGVGIEELLSAPRSQVQHISAQDVPVVHKNDGKIKVYQLLPDTLRGLAIDKMEFAPGALMKGQPHLPGTKEYFSLISGAVVLYVSGTAYALNAGDVLAFPGNQPHSYLNPESQPALALSVIIPVPAGG